MKRSAWRSILVVLGLGLVGLGTPAAAPATAGDPLFVFTPVPEPRQPPKPPPWGYLEGPCGLAVDAAGNFYVADHYHDAVGVFSSATKYLNTQLTPVDPLSGPCGLALDSTGRLYVDSYHRSVARFTPSLYPTTFAAPAVFGPPTTIDSAYPTGVAVDPAGDSVYVVARSYVAVYGPSGAPIEVGGEPLRLGAGSLGDGYGVAVSDFPATAGRAYVPDAADDTVKVYDPAVDVVDPVAVIDGQDIPGGGFVSLRDSAIAVDRVSGNVYVADNLQPQVAAEPEAAIYVFAPSGTYLGRLKYNVVDAEPPGLAVDNSAGETQGRVYVTSGNTELASVYAYPPGAETDVAMPATLRLAIATGGTGAGFITSKAAGIAECVTTCGAEVRAGAEVTLTATPDRGSAFAGWTGGGCRGTGPCIVTMDEATSLRAEFEALPPSPAPSSGLAGSEAQSSEVTQRRALRLSVGGKLSPRRLPRDGVAPIAVSVAWKIATTDSSAVPQLKKLRIEINRRGRFQYAGLPICPYDRIQPASTARALTACRSALVGQGSFEAEVAVAGQEAYVTGGRLLVFNGRRQGKPVLLGQVYSPRPFATSFVIVFAMDQLQRGPYGMALTASLPPALASWGNLTAIDMSLSRRYSFEGKRRSYISAGCPAPEGFPGAVFPLARTTFGFVGGETLASTLTRSCRVRSPDAGGRAPKIAD
jgi:DNA-binding beta-propeller fold protein YncE